MIATNMAGRGVDIKLGGDPEQMAIAALKKQGISPETEGYDEALAEKTAELEPQCKAEGEEVRELGGLFICGTERHESRRIDNQLRGRSGRQGDPGESRFFLSAEDDLIRLFAGDRIYKILDRLGPVDDDGTEVPLEAKMLTKTVENAQKKVEEQNFLIRKRVLEYDDVMNEQRRVVYRYRREILEGRDISETARDELEGVIERLVDEYTPGDVLEEWDLGELETQLRLIWPVGVDVATLAPETVDREKLKDERRRRRDERLRRARRAARRRADAPPRALDPAAGDRQPLARTPLRHGLPARRHPPPRLRPDRSPRRLQKRGLHDVRGAHALDLGRVHQTRLPRRSRSPGRRRTAAPAAAQQPALDYSGGTAEGQPSALAAGRRDGGGAGAVGARPPAPATATAWSRPWSTTSTTTSAATTPAGAAAGKKYKKCHGGLDPVREFIRAFDERDLDAFVAVLDPEVELHSSRGLRKGIEAARIWATREPGGVQQEIELEQLYEDDTEGGGGRAVALIVRRWRWEDSGELAGEEEMAWAFALRGQRVLSWRPFEDRELALRDTGFAHG